MREEAGNVAGGLLQRLSALILCSACLRRGIQTPVVQVISRHHRPRSLCPGCAATRGPVAAPAPVTRLRHAGTGATPR